MYGHKISWTGLTMVVGLTVLWNHPGVALAGAIIMILGCVLMWLDK